MAAVSEKNALKAGLFVLGSIALACVIVWFVTGKRLTGSQSAMVAFNLSDDISGLATGSEVRLGGKPIGEVRAVEFSDDFETVFVSLNLPDSVPIMADARVRVQSTLTGQVWLNIVDLGSGEPLAGDETIRGEAGTFSDLVQTVNRIAPEAELLLSELTGQTVPRINAVLDEAKSAVESVETTSESFRKTAESVTSTSDRAGSLAASLNDVFGRETTKGDLTSTLSNIRVASDGLPKLIEDANQLMAVATEAVDSVKVTVEETGNRLEGMLAKADEAAEDVVAVAQDARETTASVRGLIAGNRGRIQAIVERLGDTARTLNLASAEIRRSPWRLLYKPDGDQRANMNLYDAARQFAEGANALQDAAIALEGATQDPAADAEEVKRLLEEVQSRFENFDKAEKQLFERIRE